MIQAGNKQPYMELTSLDADQDLARDRRNVDGGVVLDDQGK